LLFFPQRALYISSLIRFRKCETIKIKVLVHFRENHQTHNNDVLMRCFIYILLLYRDEIRQGGNEIFPRKKIKSVARSRDLGAGSLIVADRGNLFGSRVRTEWPKLFMNFLYPKPDSFPGFK
jgi:hypothetical protein